MIALCGAALVAACSKGDAKGDSAKTADSMAAAASARAAPATPAPAPAATMTDAFVLARLHADNVSDSSAGKMAAEKGSMPAVKEIGRMMMKDHHAMHVDGMALAKKANISTDSPANDPDAAAEKAVADSMAAAPKGAAWDKFFIDHQVAGHEKVLEFAQEAANATQNAELKALLQKGAPIVQKHLDKAKEIQGKLNATP